MSGAEARRTPCPKDCGQEELPHVRGHGQRPRVPGCEAQVRLRGAILCPRPVAAAGRRYPMFEVRGNGREEIPCVRDQGLCPRVPGWDSAGAAERRYPHLRPGAAAWRSNPMSKGRCCTGARGPRGATPCSMSGGVAVRRYPSSKVRNSSCTLLEQP